MLPFGTQTVTLYHKGENGIERHILTGCSWRNSDAMRMYNNMQVGNASTCVCRYSPDQMRGAPGDVYILGVVRKDVRGGIELTQLLEEHKADGAFICTNFSDNSNGTVPIRHYAAKGDAYGA